MEGIVFGIAQINFNQNLSGIAKENSCSVPSFITQSSTIMSVCENHFSNSEEVANISHVDCGHNNFENNVSQHETIDDSGWEEIEDNLEKNEHNKIGYTLTERRQMPFRASKESCLLGIKRRTIMKPTKRGKSREDFKNLKPSDIKKIYLNKKLTNFRPSSLETIFEETPTAHNGEDELCNLMGGRKIKRSLSLSDGFRYSKTLVNKRRAKIKKTFGKRFGLKKISLEEFITKLNTSIEKNEDHSHDSSMEDHTSVTLNEYLKPEIFVQSTSETLDDTTNFHSISQIDSNTSL